MSDRWDVPWKKDRIEQMEDRMDAIEQQLAELRQSEQNAACGEVTANMVQAPADGATSPQSVNGALCWLRARVCELEKQRSAMAKKLMDAERDRDRYREALGRAKDMAHEIMRL